MKKTCDFIAGFIDRVELEKTIRKNFWFSGNTPAVFQTMHPYQMGFGLLKRHWKHVYETFIDFASNGYGWFYATEKDSLAVGKMLYEGFLADENFIYEKQKRWRDDLAKLHEIAAKVHKTNLAKLTNEQLAKLYQEYLASFYIAWTIPLILEMNAVYVEQVLVPKLKKNLKISGANFNEVIAILSQPFALSYLTSERIDLLKLALDFNEKGIEKHYQKYYWIKSSYRRMENYTKREIHKLIDGELRKGADHIRRELSDLEKAPKEVAARQKQIVKKYGISKTDQKLFKCMAVFGDWQDRRKEMNIYGNHHVFMLLYEISKRFHIDIDLLSSAFPSETIDALLGKGKFNKKELRQRFAFHMHAVSGNLEELFMTGKKARELKEIIDKKIEERFQEIKGTVASMGKLAHTIGEVKVVGQVKVIFDPYGADMEQGTILVTPMTRPDFIHLMYKAGAIVTDQGGVTSHAAILSRELGIPCIVGTGNATKLLKDGDQVEVDTESGTVIKL